MSPTPKRHSRSYHYSRPSVKWKFPLNSSFYSVNTDQRQQEHDEDSKKRERSDRSKNRKYVKTKIQGNGKKANVRSKSVNDRFRSGQRRNHIRSTLGSESDRSFLPNGEIGKQSLPSVGRQVRRISFSRNRQRKEFVSVQRVRKTSFSRRPLKMIVPDRIIRQRSSLSLTGIDGFDELNLQTSSWTRCFRATLRGQKLLKYCLVIVTSITTVLILRHRLLVTPPSSPFSHMPSSMPSGEPSEIPSDALSNYPSEVFHAYGYDRGESLPNVYPTHYSLSPSPSNQHTTAVPNIWVNINPSSVPSTHKSEIPSIQKINSPSMISVSVEPSSEIKYQTNEPSIATTSIKYSSMIPSKLRSTAPTQVTVLKLPSQFPSSLPTGTFTLSPSRNTSLSPSKEISTIPSVLPSSMPSDIPSDVPSDQPSVLPSSMPSDIPSDVSSDQPNVLPSVLPSSPPSLVSSAHPSSEPSSTPTLQLSLSPSDEPSVTPTSKPSLLTSNKPSILHTSSPSKQLTLSPTALKGTDTADPSLSCVDDPDFEFDIVNTSTGVRRTRNCAWLTSEPQRAQIRIERYCYSSVLENCRQTCNSC